MSDETYFKDLIRKIKELRVSSGSGEIIVPSEFIIYVNLPSINPSFCILFASLNPI